MKRWNGRNRRPSSEVLKLKWTKESGKRRGKPGREGDGRNRKRREAPVEQLWERNWEGRKETNRKPSTGTWIECMTDQAGEKGESEEARAEARTGKTTVR